MARATDKRVLKFNVTSASLSPMTIFPVLAMTLVVCQVMSTAAYPHDLPNLQQTSQDVTATKLEDAQVENVTPCLFGKLDCGAANAVGHHETIAGGKNGGDGGGGGDINTDLFRQRRWGGQGYKGIIN